MKTSFLANKMLFDITETKETINTISERTCTYSETLKEVGGIYSDFNIHVKK